MIQVSIGQCFIGGTPPQIINSDTLVFVCIMFGSICGFIIGSALVNYFNTRNEKAS